MSDLDDEFSEFEPPPRTALLRKIANGLTIAGGFALLLCGGPLIGCTLLFAGLSMGWATRYTWRSASPVDVVAPVGCGLVGGSAGLIVGSALTVLLYLMIRSMMAS